MTAHALLEDAFAHHRAGRLDQAEALYRAVLLHDPDNLNSMQLLGAIASDTSRHADAVIWLDRAAAALQARGTAVAQHAALYYNWGNALIAVGRTAEAIEAYRMGLALDPAMPALWARLAAALLQAGNPVEAAAAYEAALKLKPGQTDLLLMLGTVNAGLGRQEAAVDLFCRVLSVEPGNTEAQRALGLALVSLDRPPEAIEPLAAACRFRFSMQQWDVAAARFARSMELHPGDAETHWMLGRVEEVRCNFDAAEAAYRQALELAPDLPAALFDLGTLLYREREQPADGLALFDRLAAVAPGHAGVYCARGNALRVMHQPEQALASYERYLALAPDSALAYLRLGETLVEAGRTEAAIGYFMRCLEFDGGKNLAYLAHVDLGHALLKLHRVSEGVAHYRLALELEPLATHKAAKIPADFAALLVVAPTAYNTPYEHLTVRAPFESHILLLLPDQSYDAAFLASRADVVVNLVSDIDHDEGMLPVAAALIDRLGKPVINHPNRIHATDRASIATLVSGIASCRVARVERQPGAALLAPDFYARHAASGPFLARLAGCHGGDDFERIESADDLRHLVSREPEGDYFLIEYLDYRSPDGYFRKYRFFVLDEAILPYHLAIGDDWKVHHYRTDMANQVWMRQEEEAFLHAPEAVFEPRHFAALRAIREAIGLDFFGVDCGLGRDGTLIVFEANATMLVHADSGDFSYKNPYVQNIKTAFAAMLAKAVRGR